jgi:hypothetical protein
MASRCEAPLFAGRETLPPLWGADLVGKRLVAFVTLDACRAYATPRAQRALAAHDHRMGQPTGPIGARRKRMPDRQQAADRTVIRPSAAEITHMEAAFEWLSELCVEDSGMALVTTPLGVARRGRSIKKLCAEKQWAPHTFLRKRAKALGIINRRAPSIG